MTPERKAELRAMVEISDYGPEWKTRGETVDALTLLELLDEIERLERIMTSDRNTLRENGVGSIQEAIATILILRES